MPWRKLIDCCVREIVKDDFAKVGAVLRHGACASLAKSNAMDLPNAFKNDFAVALADNESVAGYGAPAKTLTAGQACRFRVILLRARLSEVRLRGARGWQARRSLSPGGTTARRKERIESASSAGDAACYAPQLTPMPAATIRKKRTVIGVPPVSQMASPRVRGCCASDEARPHEAILLQICMQNGLPGRTPLLASQLGPDVGEFCRNLFAPRLRLFEVRATCMFSIASIVADNFFLVVRKLRRSLPDALLAKHLLDRSERKFVFVGRNGCPEQRNPRGFSFGRVLQGFRKNFKLGHEQ
jgi:hypothetical protein